MTNRYLTGNPVGSSSPKDLFDNASNIDDWVNGPDIEYDDRLLQRRISWAGMEARFNSDQDDRAEVFQASQDVNSAAFQTFLISSGYQDLGAYAAGLVITNRNQIFSRSGEYYRASPALTLPYTLTGVWGTEGPNFVAIGDASIRQELGNAATLTLGAALVGRGTQTVDTIAQALNLSKTSSAKTVRVLGYAIPGDGGGGTYRIDDSDVSTPDDGGTVRLMADGGRLKLLDTRTLYAEQFGAKGDGVTVDDTPLANMLAVGAYRTVVLSPGKTYLLNVAMQIRSGTTLIATGATIKRGSNADNMLRNYSTGAVGGYLASSDIQVIGGTWDANRTNYATAATAIAFGHATGVTVDGVRILNVPSYHHIEVNTCQTVRITNSVFVGGAEQGAFSVEAIQIDLNIDGSQFPWFGPADAIRCEDIEISRCRFENSGTACGTHSYSGGVNHNNIRFLNNTVINPFYAGISGVNWANTRIADNSFEGGYYGVALTTAGTAFARGHVISGNSFYNIGAGGYDGAASRAIYISASDGTGTNRLSNIAITANTIIDMVTVGVSTDGVHVNYSDRISINANVVTNTRQHGIATFSCNNVSVTGNTCQINNQAAGAFASIEVNSGSTATVGHNTVETIRCVGATWAMVRNNVLSTAGGLTNTGNTGSILNENLIAGTFA